MQTLVAYCVEYCTACTGLDDCSQCAATHILDPLSHYCLTTCPDKTFKETVGAGFECTACADECLECTGPLKSDCSMCVDVGLHESFLLPGTTECYLGACPDGWIENYNTHVCECPDSYFLSGTGAELQGICQSCDPKCTLCSTSAITCQACAVGYFHYSPNTCGPTCPAGQYGYLIYDLAVCYTCDLTACVTCVNSSTTCTSCLGLAGRYLFNYSCVSPCPDGY